MGKPVFVCAHGAGGSKDDKAMLRVAAALGPLLEVVRFNFPYREAGSKRKDVSALEIGETLAAIRQPREIAAASA